ncbi:hypothetical protein HDU83_000706 [Entophlyctis luteolus]|nr:hypothetical protein HDU83_000706 [Entophlyctis luteolus]
MNVTNTSGELNAQPLFKFDLADLYPNMFPGFVGLWILSALAGVTTIVFTILICVYDRKKLFSPFNIQLFFMGFFLTTSSFDMVCTVYFCNYDAGIVKYFSLASYEYCYILYAFGRSKGVIQRVSTTLLTCLEYFVRIAPLILIMQILGPVLALSGVIDKFVWPYWIVVLPSVSGFGVFLFDLALLLAFLFYVYDSAQFDSPNRRTFLAISYFGIISCLMWVVSCALFMCGQLVFFDLNYYWNLTLVSYFLELSIVLVLMFMKLWLSKRGNGGSQNNKTNSNRTEKISKKQENFNLQNS